MGTTYTFSAPISLLSELQSYAKSEDVKVSRVIQDAVRAHLEMKRKGKINRVYEDGSARAE